MNEETRAAVETSFEALRPRAKDLVDVFYRRLFEDHPSLRPMFPADLTGQKSKLAGALALTVGNLRRPDVLGPTLRALGAKHVSYGVRDEQYPVVRDTMLAALAEVAGDLWTPALESAWTEALNAVAGLMLEGAEEARRAGARRAA